MTKYKLEYIWLDGYEPVPNLRGKTKIVEFDRFPTLEELPALGLRRQLDAAGRRQRLGLRAASRSRSSPTRRATNGVLVMCEVLLPGRHAAPEQQPRDDPGRSRHVVRVRAGVLLLRRTARPLGFPAGGGFPAPQGEYYTGVGHKNVGSIARADRRGAPRPLPRGGDQPRGHQRRGREGPVGVPDLRQGLEARRRRDVDRPLPAAPPLRALRRRRQLALQAARRRRRLERLRHAHELLDDRHARGRWQGVLPRADGRVRASTCTTTSRCTAPTTTCG